MVTSWATLCSVLPVKEEGSEEAKKKKTHNELQFKDSYLIPLSSSPQTSCYVSPLLLFSLLLWYWKNLPLQRRVVFNIQKLNLSLFTAPAYHSLHQLRWHSNSRRQSTSKHWDKLQPTPAQMPRRGVEVREGKEKNPFKKLSGTDFGALTSLFSLMACIHGGLKSSLGFGLVGKTYIINFHR